MKEKERFELEMMATPELARHVQEKSEDLRDRKEKYKLLGAGKHEIDALKNYIKIAKKIIESRQMKMF